MTAKEIINTVRGEVDRLRALCARLEGLANAAEEDVTDIGLVVELVDEAQEIINDFPQSREPHPRDTFGVWLHIEAYNVETDQYDDDPDPCRIARFDTRADAEMLKVLVHNMTSDQPGNDGVMPNTTPWTEADITSKVTRKVGSVTQEVVTTSRPLTGSYQEQAEHTHSDECCLTEAVGEHEPEQCGQSFIDLVDAGDPERPDDPDHDHMEHDDERSEQLDDAVHDAKGEEAAAINNAGLDAQREYLGIDEPDDAERPDDPDHDHMERDEGDPQRGADQYAADREYGL